MKLFVQQKCRIELRGVFVSIKCKGFFLNFMNVNSYCEGREYIHKAHEMAIYKLQIEY